MPYDRYALELQDFVIKGITSQLRFSEVNPLLVERRGGLIKSLLKQHELDQWAQGEGFVDVSDPARGIALNVTNREMRAMFERVDQVADVVDASRAFFELVDEVLEVGTIAGVGVRSWRMAAVDDFESLNGWLLEDLLNRRDPLFEPFGHPPSDVGWAFDFHEADPKHNLRIGPMKREQAMAQLFRDQTEANYPSQFLMIDLDRFYSDEERTPAADALERWERTLTRNLEISEAVGRVLSPDHDRRR